MAYNNLRFLNKLYFALNCHIQFEYLILTLGTELSGGAGMVRDSWRFYRILYRGLLEYRPMFDYLSLKLCIELDPTERGNERTRNGILRLSHPS